MILETSGASRRFLFCVYLNSELKRVQGLSRSLIILAHVLNRTHAVHHAHHRHHRHHSYSELVCIQQARHFKRHDDESVSDSQKLRVLSLPYLRAHSRQLLTFIMEHVFALLLW